MLIDRMDPGLLTNRQMTQMSGEQRLSVYYPLPLSPFPVLPLSLPLSWGQGLLVYGGFVGRRGILPSWL